MTSTFPPYYHQCSSMKNNGLQLKEVWNAAFMCVVGIQVSKVNRGEENK